MASYVVGWVARCSFSVGSGTWVWWVGWCLVLTIAWVVMRLQVRMWVRLRLRLCACVHRRWYASDVRRGINVGGWRRRYGGVLRERCVPHGQPVRNSRRIMRLRVLVRV